MKKLITFITTLLIIASGASAAESKFNFGTTTEWAATEWMLNNTDAAGNEFWRICAQKQLPHVFIQLCLSSVTGKKDDAWIVTAITNNNAIINELAYDLPAQSGSAFPQLPTRRLVDFIASGSSFRRPELGEHEFVTATTLNTVAELLDAKTFIVYHKTNNEFVATHISMNGFTEAFNEIANRIQTVERDYMLPKQ